MAGDFTRFSFDPKRHPAGVLFQQGRVVTDADLDELVELIDRRLRSGTLDEAGPLVFAPVTPDAFKLAAAGSSFTIAPGRAYVDGLQAECFGAGAQRFVADLETSYGVDPVPYESQPYWSDALPPLPTGGTHLVYLDVWRREVGFVEEPSLIDPAIGFDTSTRLQTVWQVRVLAHDQPGLTCDTPDEKISGWSELTAPSAGRLSTDAVATPSSDDPCIVPPAGGYRGVENRLYRVEIHTPGPLGTATFKWSHDDASIVVPVTAINAARDTLTVTRIGRDDTLRFATDDWVEITDERRVLAGLPGELRQVDLPDDVQATIKLRGAPLPADLDPTISTRRTRVIRWDQKGKVLDPLGNPVDDVSANAGFVKVPTGGAKLILEDGVQVVFSTDPAGGDFKVGDFWCFAARTADASVERLVEAPPRGIHHHYGRLGVWTPGSAPINCRPQPPAAHDDGCCDCTECVTPESHASGVLTLQAAIDAVGPDGGKVCIAPGRYLLERSLMVRHKKALTLQGHGLGTLLVHVGPGPGMLITASSEVRVLDLVLATAGPSSADPETLTPGDAVVRIASSVWTDIERCALIDVTAFAGATTGTTDTNASFLNHASEVGAVVAVGGGRVAIMLDGIVVQTGIRDNLLVGAIGVAGLPRRSDSLDVKTRGFLLTIDLDVERNVMLCAISGVLLGFVPALKGDGATGITLHLLETRLERNLVVGARLVGIGLFGAVGGLGGGALEGGALQLLSGGASGGSARVEVRENLLAVPRIGIFAGTSDTTIADNDVRFPDTPIAGGAGIAISRGLDPRGVQRTVVSGNRIVGSGGTGVSIGNRVVSLRVEQNEIEQAALGGIVADDRSRVGELAVVGNALRGIASSVGEGDWLSAIRVIGADRAEIRGNTIDGVGAALVSGARVAGIFVAACASARVLGNELVDVGPDGPFQGEAVGIDVVLPFDRLDVAENAVRPPEPDARRRARFIALRIVEAGDGANAAPVVVDVAGPSIVRSAIQAVPLEFVRELVMQGISIHAAPLEGDAQPPAGPAFSIRGNRLEANGAMPSLLVRSEQLRGLANDNHVVLVTAGGSVAAFVQAQTLILNANLIDGDRQKQVVILEVGGPATVLGNIANGLIELNGAPLAAPWDALNL